MNIRIMILALVATTSISTSVLAINYTDLISGVRLGDEYKPHDIGNAVTSVTPGSDFVSSCDKPADGVTYKVTGGLKVELCVNSKLVYRLSFFQKHGSSGFDSQAFDHAMKRILGHNTTITSAGGYDHATLQSSSAEDKIVRIKERQLIEVLKQVKI